jgi:hypothetical protein
LSGQEIFVLRAGELSRLLESAELLREDDTSIAGKIRILRDGNRILVQEQVPETKKVIVRQLPSREDAERFVDDRLSTYDRMWDGCGCKIDYYK